MLVAAVSFGVWQLAAEWKGDQPRGNQVDVVDFDVESHLARGSTWFGLFSPNSADYPVALRPNWHGPHAEPSEVQLSWLGLPGRGLGGMMNPTTAELPLFTRPYACPPDADRIGPAPLATWSSKSFTGRWNNTDARLIDADLRATADRQLTGTIGLPAQPVSETANNAERSNRISPGRKARVSPAGEFKLTDCLLFYDRYVYKVPELAAGGSPIDIRSLEAPQSVETELTRRSLVDVAPYDRASLDRARILEIMMFYRAAGGPQYVGLSNRYQHELDLSGHLDLGQAILVGRGPPAVEWTIDGQELPSSAMASRVTYYRFVIPVRATSP